jgi:putative transposase
MLARTFGCVRYVYNWALRLRIETYKAEKRSLSTNELSKRLTALKQQKDVAFLNEVSSVPLQQALRHLADAFTNFFEGRASYPKFKARHDKQAAEYSKSAFTWDGKILRLTKMEEPLDICWSRPAIVRKPDAKWPASMHALPIAVATINTNSRLASFARTKRFASRVCASRI